MICDFETRLLTEGLNKREIVWKWKETKKKKKHEERMKVN